MQPSDCLETLLAQAMLSSEATRQLIKRTSIDPMPFHDLRSNLILAVIRKLHAKQLPIDILTVFETLHERIPGLHLDELASMVKAPFIEPLFADGLSIRPFQGGDVASFVDAFRESVSTVGK